MAFSKRALRAILQDYCDFESKTISLQHRCFGELFIFRTRTNLFMKRVHLICFPKQTQQHIRNWWNYVCGSRNSYLLAAKRSYFSSERLLGVRFSKGKRESFLFKLKRRWNIYEPRGYFLVIIFDIHCVLRWVLRSPSVNGWQVYHAICRE